jgi:hypothetical protein
MNWYIKQESKRKIYLFSLNPLNPLQCLVLQKKKTISFVSPHILTVPPYRLNSAQLCATPVTLYEIAVHVKGTCAWNVALVKGNFGADWIHD